MEDRITLTMTSEQIDIVKRELVKCRLLEAQNGVKKPRENKTWKKKIKRAKRLYGHSEPLRGPGKIIMQGWALLWYGIFNLKSKLEDINRAP